MTDDDPVLAERDRQIDEKLRKIAASVIAALRERKASEEETQRRSEQSRA